MKIFMTGATGYIGGAVAARLREAGHEITALVRDSGRAARLASGGVRLVEGDLGSLLDHREEIANHEVYVHTAASQKNAIELDETAIHAFTRNHDGRHFIYTSGVWVLGNTGPAVADEAAPPRPLDIVAWRPKHERYVLEEGRDNFTTSVLRPGCVYGGRQSLLAGWFAAAEKGDPVEIIGDGVNRWAMVHLSELADCYLLAVEKRVGGVLHGVDDTRATIRECAEALAKESGGKSEVRTVPLGEARVKLGVFADALAVDQEVASHSTRQRVEWNPKKTFVGSIREQWKEWREKR
ncbi:MAG TPA: NAD-dependent epimerase/dehydratase family protein [Thermoanaerobaculia bacterium]|nr:NAD-dependent epimerase/dehydratase family protein [Thermoanaerobaculia bacterium]